MTDDPRLNLEIRKPNEILPYHLHSFFSNLREMPPLDLASQTSTTALPKLKESAVRFVVTTAGGGGEDLG
jgi:hypothetical protein